jgi:hypothetical protein
MMRQAKMFGLCTVSVVAIGSLGLASSAQALPTPEFLKGGKPITTTSFTTSGGSGEFQLGSTAITWSGASATGVLESPDKLSELVLKFTGDKIGSCEVNSPGAKAGEVVTSKLKGVLGYIKESSPVVVGVLFEPAAGTKFVEIEKSGCNPTKYEVTGSVIGEIEPINKVTDDFKVVFGITRSKVQEIKKFEGEATEHQLKYGEIAVAFACNEVLTPVEELEIKT